MNTFSNIKPFTHQIRSSQSPFRVKKETSIQSIDEQIAALENSDTDSSDSEDDGKAVDANDHLVMETNEHGEVIKLVSVIEFDERIEPLPKKYLPGMSCSTSKKFSKEKGDLNLTSNKKTSKRARFTDNVEPKSALTGNMYFK